MLDIGCGPGFSMDVWKEEGADVYGIDVVEEMVKMAKKRGHNVWLASADCLPFKDDMFDAVFSVAALQWVKEKREMKNNE